MKLESKLSQQQKLSMTMQMREALHVLQLPISELALWVQEQIEQNPLLQFEDSSPQEEMDLDITGFEVLDELDETFVQGVFPEEPPQSSSIENFAASSKTLYEYLMEQAKTFFSTRDELEQAENIIGNLDERGFLGNLDVDPKILEAIQSFDPPGIAARNLQDSLLIQLKFKRRESSLSYTLIQDHFEDLLQGRLTSVTKKLQITVQDLQSVLRKTIATLDFNPGGKFRPISAPSSIPDIIIEKIDQGFHLKINDSLLPSYVLSVPSFAHLSHHYACGRWMEKVIAKRSEILTKITRQLLEHHAPFFAGSTEKLAPLSTKKMAKILHLHESTIARAIKDKFLACPQGIFPLNYFFPRVSTSNGISSITAKHHLHELIEKEDKKRPLSDDALAQLMAEAGIPCARRTVTKYRRLLKIPSASHRRNFWSFSSRE